MSKENNIIIYLLISSLDPPQKIFELINSVDQQAYVQAHEIFNNYVNLYNEEEINSKYIKIPLDDDHAFHVFITEQGLILISYTNIKKFNTEKNFYLLEDINEFLTTEVKRKINEGQSFLIEEEKNEIKDIIEYYAEGESDFLDSVNTIQTENESENADIKKGIPDSTNLNINLKKEEKKNELTLSKKPFNKTMLKNTISLANNKPNMKPRMSFTQSLRMRNLARTVKLDKNKLKNKVNFNIESFKQTKKNNNLTNNKLYETTDLSKIGKSDLCTKITIITILSIIGAVQIIGTVLFIYFYDNDR